MYWYMYNSMTNTWTNLFSSYLQLVSEYVGVGSVQFVDIDVGNPLLPAKQFVIWKAQVLTISIMYT